MERTGLMVRGASYGLQRSCEARKSTGIEWKDLLKKR